MRWHLNADVGTFDAAAYAAAVLRALGAPAGTPVTVGDVEGASVFAKSWVKLELVPQPDGSTAPHEACSTLDPNGIDGATADEAQAAELARLSEQLGVELLGYSVMQAGLCAPGASTSSPLEESNNVILSPEGGAAITIVGVVFAALGACVCALGMRAVHVRLGQKKGVGLLAGLSRRLGALVGLNGGGSTERSSSAGSAYKNQSATDGAKVAPADMDQSATDGAQVAPAYKNHSATDGATGAPADCSTAEAVQYPLRRRSRSSALSAAEGGRIFSARSSVRSSCEGERSTTDGGSSGPSTARSVIEESFAVTLESRVFVDEDGTAFDRLFIASPFGSPRDDESEHGGAGVGGPGAASGDGQLHASQLFGRLQRATSDGVTRFDSLLFATPREGQQRASEDSVSHGEAEGEANPYALLYNRSLRQSKVGDMAHAPQAKPAALFSSTDSVSPLAALRARRGSGSAPKQSALAEASSGDVVTRSFVMGRRLPAFRAVAEIQQEIGQVTVQDERPWDPAIDGPVPFDQEVDEHGQARNSRSLPFRPVGERRQPVRRWLPRQKPVQAQRAPWQSVRSRDLPQFTPKATNPVPTPKPRPIGVNRSLPFVPADDAAKRAPTRSPRSSPRPSPQLGSRPPSAAAANDKPLAFDDTQPSSRLRTRSPSGAVQNEWDRSASRRGGARVYMDESGKAKSMGNSNSILMLDR